MRILHVNKFVYRRGGAEGYMLDVAGIQRAAGHEVAFYGMAHPENDPTEFSSEFAPYIEMNPPPAGAAGQLRGFARMVWSTAAASGLSAVLDRFRPDVVHLHNVYHQLSPSVLAPIRRRSVPAVMTLHDYKLACPTYNFLAHGEVCEACLGGRFHNAVRRRCKDGSLAASTAAAVELTLHTMTDAYGPVGLFLCPSHFMATKMEEAGVYTDRLRWIPHFVEAATVRPTDAQGAGVVFAGRLSAEKGVDVLIAAFARMAPGVTLHIAGDGPERQKLEALATEHAPGRVLFHGRVAKDDLHDLIRSSTVVVLPSRWYENQPMIVLEAFACGVPVVGTHLGGTPELVEPGVDGQLVAAGDPTDLAAALETFVADPARAFEMGRKGRARVERDFAPDAHLHRLGELYAEAGAVIAP